MKGIISIIFIFCSLAAYTQYGYDNDYIIYDDPTDDFGESHQKYLLEDIEISSFDREEYEKIKKLMILKSMGRVVVDMDNVDPNFDPERYFENSAGPGGGDGNGGGLAPGGGGSSGNGYGGGGNGNGYGGGSYEDWSREYEPGDGEYAEDWNEYYEDNYDQYDRNQKEDRREIKKRDAEASTPASRKKEDPNSGSGGGLLLILLLVLVLVLVIGFLFFSKGDGAKVPQGKLEDLAPTEIPKSELELMLEKALANKDYRKAIRIYFIFMMKDLSEKGWIVWQKKKTNMLYLREMKGRPHYDQFKRVVSIYEVVWYGKREVSEADYKSIEPMLKQTLIDLENHK